MKDVQLPHYKEDCVAAFFDAIHRLDMESISQFIEAMPAGSLVSLVDAQGNSTLHVALQVANAQAAAQATTLVPLQQEIIQLFLTLQCDERQRNKQGVTPLDLAAQCPTAAIRGLFPALSVAVEIPAVEVASPRGVSAVTSPRASEGVRGLESGSEVVRAESGKGDGASRVAVESRVSLDASTRVPIESTRIPIDTPTRTPIEAPTRIPTTTKTPSEATTKTNEETGNEETADEESSPTASQTQLQPSSTVEELLQTLGLQEYITVFRAKVSEGRGVERRDTRCVRTSSRSTRRTSRRWE